MVAPRQSTWTSRCFGGRSLILSLCPEEHWGGPTPAPDTPEDPDLAAALELSRRDDAADQQRSQEEDEEETRRAIKLSLLEE